MSRESRNQIYEIIDVPRNTGVRFFTSTDSGSYIPSHWHAAVEIIYMQEGELTVSIESSSRVLHRDQCMIINSGIIHSTKCTAPNRAIVFQIPADFISLYIPDAEMLLFTLEDPARTPILQTKIRIFKDTLLQMQLVDDLRPKEFLLRFNSLLFEVLYQLYHNFSVSILPSGQNRKNKALDRLNKVLSYTTEHYDRPISLEEISGIACLESGYFCRFFKKYMGITFLEYQNELRLSHIYHDLINTSDTVHDILERHGFTNYKLFRRMFSEHFHTTPSRIRFPEN